MHSTRELKGFDEKREETLSAILLHGGEEEHLRVEEECRDDPEEPLFSKGRDSVKRHKKQTWVTKV